MKCKSSDTSRPPMCESEPRAVGLADAYLFDLQRGIGLIQDGRFHASSSCLSVWLFGSMPKMAGSVYSLAKPASKWA